MRRRAQERGEGYQLPRPRCGVSPGSPWCALFACYRVSLQLGRASWRQFPNLGKRDALGGRWEVWATHASQCSSSILDHVEETPDLRMLQMETLKPRDK